MPAQNQPLFRRHRAGVSTTSGENSGDEEDDGIFCEQAEAESGADGEPPARVFGFEEANGEVSGEHPPEEIERGVLELGSVEEGQRESATASAAVNLREAAAAEFPCHESGDDNGRSLQR